MRNWLKILLEKQKIEGITKIHVVFKEEFQCVMGSKTDIWGYLQNHNKNVKQFPTRGREYFFNEALKAHVNDAHKKLRSVMESFTMSKNNVSVFNAPALSSIHTLGSIDKVQIAFKEI